MKSPRHRIARRLTAALACTGLVAGCSSDGGGDWIAMFDAARSSWENRNAGVELKDAAGIPYATLGVRIDGGREQILILGQDENGERLWTSSARVAITTRGGRIVRTSGFGTDLSGYTATGPREDWSRPHAYTWTADFSDLGYYSVPVTCDVRPAGADPITILGQSFNTTRVDETCHADTLRWSFSNTYWVNTQTGRVWRAQAHFHPKGPALDLEILRPPLSPE